MQSAPKSVRLHIGLFGRRNVGKSSLLNALVRQNVAIVSARAGTTTDPVEKPMELLPFGPVLFVDTAGLDDEGALGSLRMEKTRAVLERTDLGLIVSDGAWGAFEDKIAALFAAQETPFLAVFNKADKGAVAPDLVARLEGRGVRCQAVAATTGAGVEVLRAAIADAAPDAVVADATILGDLVGPGEAVVLVVPIDKEAPKGRLILPQVQVLRDLLDQDAMALVVKERELRPALARLATPPKLVVTDSQVFLKVAADTPPSVLMTSFSILFARYKGDLVAQTRGARAIDSLRAGDRVLVAEACTHRPLCDDIGRVKIPRWLTQFAGGALTFAFAQGHDFPEDLTPYKLVIHCGACMLNRRAVRARIARCEKAGVPVTNYGMAIAHSLGILERALQPFPAAHALYTESRGA